MTYKGKLFVYHWHIDETEKEVTSIRIYGINRDGNTVCLRVDDFTPYIYIELPEIITTHSQAQLVSTKINSMTRNKKPLSTHLQFKKKLYGAHFDKEGNRRLFPYLMCTFSNINDIKSLYYQLKKSVYVNGIGNINLRVHESDASPVLQLTCCRGIPTTGWVNFASKHGEINEEDKVTLSQHEFKISWKSLSPFKLDMIPEPLIMGFDIEVNSDNPSKFPSAKNPNDKVFQISCVFSRHNTNTFNKYLLTLGCPDQQITGEDVNIMCFKTEASLLTGYSELIRKFNPNVIVGYNILSFDIPYLIDRSKFNLCNSEFEKQGFHKYNRAKERTIKWSSSAYKNQEFQFLDAEGRLFIDLLPLIKRDFKMNNYKLKTVTEYFIGETKDPLSVQGIFKCYKLGVKKNDDNTYDPVAKKAMAICGKYCIQDSVLVIKLMEKLKTWVGLVEMAKTCQVPIFSLYTQGQQIRVFSQVYKYCLTENIVVEKDGYTVNENERYVGAHVFPPVPGVYDKVVPFDFASLYPTTIIAYNIDYHTFVTDPDIPDEACHVMEWQDCIGCCHDPKVIRKINLTKHIDAEQIKIKQIREKRNKIKCVVSKKKYMDEIQALSDQLKPYLEERSEINKTKPKFPMCEKRKYRFLKQPIGVIPTVLQNLLSARKKTRKVDMKKCYDELRVLESEENVDHEQINNLKSLIDVLDKRQLAYKVSCNSMYGAMGVRRGYLPFMPGAMCTTYMGRVNIEKVAEIIPRKFGGNLVYGDTDSNYIHFPEFKTASETWDHALFVASELTKIFPPPIELEFENEIYDFFFILTKKRYMYRKCLRDGVVDKKMGTKGVLLARRDNSNFVRKVYERVVDMIADSKSKDEILMHIIEELNLLCSNRKDIDDFVITKSVGDIGDGSSIVPFTNEKGVNKCKMGEYIIPVLPIDPEEYSNELKKKSVSTSNEYYISCLPPQVQLAEKMKKRGERVDPGTRLEYVVSDPTNHTLKLYQKIESVEYFKNHKDVLKIDTMYYIKALANPLDEVLNVAFEDVNNFVLDQYNIRYKKRNKLHKQIVEIFHPDVQFGK